jgi:hypothetical protein
MKGYMRKAGHWESTTGQATHYTCGEEHASVNRVKHPLWLHILTVEKAVALSVVNSVYCVQGAALHEAQNTHAGITDWLDQKDETKQQVGPENA